jgi:hypothetical protein
MKFTIALTLISSAYAFSPAHNAYSTKVSTKIHSSNAVDADKPLRDPFGLYPEDALERKSGLLQPLEDVSTYATITDPMNLYTDKSEIDENVMMSASLPFLKRPEMLDGTLPGDRGFDPLNFSSDKNSLEWYRNAEIKHGRLAMLAAAGWPLAELLDKKLAYAVHLKPLLVFQDRVPSVLNGGLSRISPIYWVAVLGVATMIEAYNAFETNEAKQKGEELIPGDLGFDPLGLFGKTDEDKQFKLEAEIFNGRLGMLAITGFAIQEWVTQNAVINEFPIFFKPINVALEQLADASGNML